MADDNWERVREIFHSALSCQPEERQNSVNEACGKDERLRAEVLKQITVAALEELPPYLFLTPPGLSFILSDSEPRGV